MSLFRKLSCFFFLIMINAFFLSAHDSPTRIESILEMPIDHPEETLILFDIDDTLIDSSNMLGSKAWRKYISQATADAALNWHDLFSLYIAENSPIVPVESMTTKIVKDLQAKGYVVCGLTSRERNKWYDLEVEGIDLLTISQLKSVDIQFDDDLLKQKYLLFSQNSEYFEGVFFANLEPKGEYLRFLWNSLEASELPKKVLFIDDKLSQVESVASTLNDLQIDHECYWYCATEKKPFSALIANIQLYYLLLSDGCDVLSDQEAAKIAMEDSSQTADYYLHNILSLAQEKLCKIAR